MQDFDGNFILLIDDVKSWTHVRDVVSQHLCMAPFLRCERTLLLCPRSVRPWRWDLLDGLDRWRHEWVLRWLRESPQMGLVPFAGRTFRQNAVLFIGQQLAIYLLCHYKHKATAVQPYVQWSVDNKQFIYVHAVRYQLLDIMHGTKRNARCHARK